MTSENIQILNYEVRPGTPEDSAKADEIWLASQEADSKSYRPRNGWWSLTGWTDKISFLFESAKNKPIGVLAFKTDEENKSLDFRLALLPENRQPAAATYLLESVVQFARQVGSNSVHSFFSAQSTWVTNFLPDYGLQLQREFHMMLRPTAQVTPADLQAPAGIQIRPMRDGEETQVLDALNRAWATTWNYRPISMEALEKDLERQREGFLVAIDESNPQQPIVGTVHGIFDAATTNPDGSPFAWISNVTTDPQVRGRGVGRAVLLAGINYLAQRGAESVGLGVDGGNPIPVNLYRSVGFEIYNTNQLWEGRPTAKNTL